MYTLFAKIKLDHFTSGLKYSRVTLQLPILDIEGPVHFREILAKSHHRYFA